MKYIINNPTEEQLNFLKSIGLCVYCEYEHTYCTDVPEIKEEELPEGVVDLGLQSGLKWASCNIGAYKPYEYGKLFQFGRTDGYYHDDPSHKFRTYKQNKADTGNRYIPLTTSGKTYAAGEVLDPADDAAYAATNGTLRMPTADEISELIYGTINEWCQCNSVLGRLFTSKKDASKKIFIPAAGNFNRYDFNNEEFRGYVWSSSVNSYADNCAYSLYFYSDVCYCTDRNRYRGLSVRGVMSA